MLYGSLLHTVMLWEERQGGRLQRDPHPGMSTESGAVGIHGSLSPAGESRLQGDPVEGKKLK